MDLLDLTTVYQKGKSVGVRIGKLAENSLGQALGFMTGDIVTKINNLSTADSANKLKIYQEVTSLKSGDTLTVTLVRNHQEIVLTMKIVDFENGLADQAGKDYEPESAKAYNDESYKERVRMLEQKQKFAPTVREIKMAERRNMMQKGKIPVIDTKSNIAEEESGEYE
jgi:hypothetical protein